LEPIHSKDKISKKALHKEQKMNKSFSLYSFLFASITYYVNLFERKTWSSKIITYSMNIIYVLCKNRALSIFVKYKFLSSYIMSTKLQYCKLDIFSTYLFSVLFSDLQCPLILKEKVLLRCEMCGDFITSLVGNILLRR